MFLIALVLAGCSDEEAPQIQRLEDAIHALAEEALPGRVPSSARVDLVVCRPLTKPSYACEVHYGDSSGPTIQPFCAELRDGAVYMNSTREGCGPPTRGYSYTRATTDDFT